MGNQTHPAYRGPWPRIRKQILQRDNHLCQIRGPRCTSTATHVDHIIPITQGGPWWEPDNLRASCKNCNNDRIDRKQTDRWRNSNTHITLIIGPPGINKHTGFTPQPGDLIIDYDNITQAIGIEAHPDLHGPALAARGALLREVKAGKVKSKRAFIISSNPKAEGMFPYHTVKVVDPGEEAAILEARRSSNPPHMERLVRDWYRQRRGDSQRQAPNSRNW